jgi:hypothetical protein
VLPSAGVIVAERTIGRGRSTTKHAERSELHSCSKSDLFTIRYRAAVIAEHEQEAALGAPDTMLISTSDIITFDYVGHCSTFRTF